MKDLLKYRPLFHETIYFLAFLFIVVGIYINRPMVSSGMIALSANWLLEMDFKRKWKVLISSKTVLFMVAFYLFHLLSLFWSTDYGYAMNDLRIKLPMLSIPIVLASMKPISIRLRQIVLYFFIAGTFISSFMSLYMFFGFNGPIHDFRELSPYISHIRLSLIVSLAIFVCFYLIRKFQHNKFLISILSFSILWFFGYMLLLRSTTGILAFSITAYVILTIYVFRSNFRKKALYLVGLISLPVLFIGLLAHEVKEFNDIEKVNPQTVDKYTAYGNPYTFDFDNGWVENGHEVQLYVCEKEMREAWNERSSMDYDGKDLRDQNLYQTLTRYLTSKNLRKDREGVYALSEKDIEAVESGVANERELHPYNIRYIIYVYIWELHNYFEGGNPQGNTLAQRLLFWKIGWGIFKEHPIFGVGVGDVKMAYMEAYDNLPFNVEEKFRLRAHNQYLTVAISFGLVGLVIFLLALIFPFVEYYKTVSVLFVAHFILSALSMLNEDTLETQVGLTFLIFFFYWFLFHFQKESTA